jgi:hypothetical protein
VSKFYGLDKFEEGSYVKIASRSALETFQREWRLHHPLSDAQLSYADKTAKVVKSSMYHGGDILYELEDVPGIWHQICLSALPE